MATNMVHKDFDILKVLHIVDSQVLGFVNMLYLGPALLMLKGF